MTAARIVPLRPPRYMAEKGEAILAAGYRIIPIGAGQKSPILRDWPNINATPELVRSWVDMFPDAGIGIVARDTPAIDIDTLDTGMADQMLRYIWFDLCLPAPHRVGNAPKVLLVFRTDAPFRKLSTPVYIDDQGREHRLEALGDGQQFVWAGVHPNTGKPYRSQDLPPAAELPLLTVEIAQAIIAKFCELAEARGWTRKADPLGHLPSINDPDPPDWAMWGDRIRHALNAIPADDREIWVQCVGAIKYESEDSAEGLELAHEWSMTSGKYGGVDALWDSFHRTSGARANRRTIYKLAEKLGGWDRATAPGPKAEKITIGLKSGGAYRMQRIEWLWPGWLALGKFHVLGGLKSAGKSTLVFSLAAAVTTGGKWPDGTSAPLGDVLIWSGEDGIEDTILPRIAACGGNVNRIYFPDRIGDRGENRRFDPATDMPLLLEAARALPELRMMIIDPIVSASAADSHKNAETRRGLQPVVDFAEERRVALIGITHFTKNTQGKNPIERITGTLAYGALPRVVMGAAKAGEDAPRRLVRIASNIGRSGGGFEYLLRQKPVPGHDFTAQTVDWGKQLADEAGALLDEIEQPRTERFKAGAFLEDMLTKAGEVGVAVKELRAAAEAHCVAWRTIERAKDAEDRIKAQKTGTGWRWVWADFEL